MATRPVTFTQITATADALYALDRTGILWCLDKKAGKKWLAVERPEEPVPVERSCYWHAATCTCKHCLAETKAAAAK